MGITVTFKGVDTYQGKNKILLSYLRNSYASISSLTDEGVRQICMFKLKCKSDWIFRVYADQMSYWKSCSMTFKLITFIRVL